MNISFLGAARMVTGSCYLIETQKTKFLVDCGLFQGGRDLNELNYNEFAFNPADIDFMLLTHAHIDHSGLIPKLINNGFAGSIYATAATVDLCSILLPDCGHIQEMEVERKNRKALRSGGHILDPIYTAEDGANAINNFVKVRYEKEINPAIDVRVVYQDAGHILGSAILEVYISEDGAEKKILFTGDLGRKNRPIIKDPAIIEEADYLLIESTYGNREHIEERNFEEKLRDIINNTFARGGNVIIPAFAVDRSQDLLLTLNRLYEREEINPSEVYLDSPLAIAATEIFSKHPGCYDDETMDFIDEHGICPFLLPNLKYSRTAEDSQRINEIKSNAVIISASGMADAGRIRHHLKHNLWRPESTVIFIGYQAQGTLGRQLVDGAKMVSIHGESIAVKADIVYFDFLSAHADRNEIISWAENFKSPPKKVFVVHGEESQSIALADELLSMWHTEIIVPSIGDIFDLSGVSENKKVFLLQKEQELLAALSYYSTINERLSALAKTGEYEKLKEIAEMLDKMQ